MKEIIDLGHENNQGLELGLDLKNVLFERDDLTNQLDKAHKDIRDLMKKLKHFESVQIQLETFDDEDVYERIDKVIIDSAYKTKMDKQLAGSIND